MAIVPPYPPGGAVAAAVRVTVDASLLDPGVMVDGDSAQVTPAGTFEQESSIGLLNPPTGLALTDSIAD